MFKNAKVLVTGGAGFVGTNLILRLLDLGAQVTATIHKKEPQIKDPRVAFIRAELLNAADCEKVCAGQDYVFMCAANTSGAGVTGTLAVARSTPDGHNLVILTGGTPSQQLLRPDQPYNLLKDFAMVTTICAYPMVIAVAPNSPIKTFADLIARAKAQPGKVTYSMNSIGSLHHLLGEWIGIDAGVQMEGIPYRGSPPAFMDVSSGRVDVMIDTGTFVLPQIEQKQLRGLAQSAPGKYALAPDIPAVTETLPNVQIMSWLGFAMAKNTPKPIVDRLNAEITAILDQEEVKQKLAQMGNIPMPSKPEDMLARIDREMAQWKRVIDAKGIKAE